MLLQRYCLPHCQSPCADSRTVAVSSSSRFARSTGFENRQAVSSSRILALDANHGGDTPHEEAVALQLAEVLQARHSGALKLRIWRQHCSFCDTLNLELLNLLLGLLPLAPIFLVQISCQALTSSPAMTASTPRGRTLCGRGACTAHRCLEVSMPPFDMTCRRLLLRPATW